MDYRLINSVIQFLLFKGKLKYWSSFFHDQLLEFKHWLAVFPLLSKQLYQLEVATTGIALKEGVSVSVCA
jgi:hypothetical protein